ncbi:STAS domain-containing protein [Streptomyces sp. NPDC088762]|uniref:STAS domain-containing protein n=1 Tax=Streptomyces sp. NPDC088762 TaxID=3365891 RepID=UPI0038210BFF
MQGDDQNGREGLEVEAHDGTTVVRPYGEMDLGRAADFRRALLSALTDAPRPQQVAVDLRHLAFCDSSGLNALLHARALAAEHGQSLRLVAPQLQFLRLLELTGALPLFTIEPDPPF